LVSVAQSPLKIILDTDIDSDVDDVGALAMLHTLADHQVVEILGIIVTVMIDMPYPVRTQSIIILDDRIYLLGLKKILN
jgi:hypothetical protein